MKTVFYILILSLLTGCDPGSPPPDKNATYQRPQVEYNFDKPKPYFDIKDALAHIDSARILILTGSPLDTFPTAILKLTNLEELQLTGCGLRSIPEDIKVLKKLKVLSLRNNHLITLPTGLFELTDLEELDNFGNEIKSLNPDIGNLVKLKALNVSFNKLNVLPDLSNLANLHNLSCDGNFLTSIPPGICNLKMLHRLSLLRNKISKVDACISQLSHLNSFIISQNPLSETQIDKVRQLLPNCDVNSNL